MNGVGRRDYGGIGEGQARQEQTSEARTACEGSGTLRRRIEKLQCESETRSADRESTMN